MKDQITEQILLLKDARIAALEEQVALLKSQVELLEQRSQPVTNIVQGPWRKVH